MDARDDSMEARHEADATSSVDASLLLTDDEIERLTPSSSSATKALLDEIRSDRAPWREVARPSQRAPRGDWFIWLILAGRGWGKDAQRRAA